MSKENARKVQARLRQLGHEVPLTHCYEVIASAMGFKNWNVAKAKSKTWIKGGFGPCHSCDKRKDLNGFDICYDCANKPSDDIDPLKLVRNQDWDAQKWAKSFIGMLRKNPNVEIDEGLMTGWFANAIMACHDDLHNTKIKELEEKKAKLMGLMILTDPAVSNQVVTDLQIIQHEEWLNTFPDERRELDRWLNKDRVEVAKSGKGSFYTREELMRRAKC